MLQTFCIGHRGLAFDPPAEFVFVSQADQGLPRQVIVPESAFPAAMQVTALSEYAKLFGLADLLARGGASGRVMVFQYRKFLAYREGSRRSTNQSFAFAIPPEEAVGLFPNAAEIEAHADAMLVGPAIDVGSLAANYAQYHVIDDFVAFTLSLRATIFDDATCVRFLRCGALIPVPSLGIFELPFFLDQMARLRAAWTHFAANFHVPREGYQQRVGGFLLERLQSFLLWEALAVRKTARARQGHFIVVSPTATVQPTI